MQRRNNLSPDICTKPSPVPLWAQDNTSNCYSDALPIVNPSITSEVPLHQHDGDGVVGFTLFMAMTSNLSILSIPIPRGEDSIKVGVSFYVYPVNSYYWAGNRTGSWGFLASLGLLTPQILGFQFAPREQDHGHQLLIIVQNFRRRFATASDFCIRKHHESAKS